MFVRLTSQIKKPIDRIYMWSPILEPNYNHIETIERWKQIGIGEGPENWEKKPIIEIEHSELKYRHMILDHIQKDIVVIGLKDHLTTGNFNPWLEEYPIIVRSLQGLFESYDDKKFILFTSMENLEEYIKFDNLYIIPWGGDITNQISEYKSLLPIINKDFNSPYTFVSLNRGYRYHRAVLVSLLFGLDLHKYGMISCMFKDDIVDLTKDIKWSFSSKQKKILDKGFRKFKKTDLIINDDVEIYQKNNNNNVGNFQNKLSRYYQQTFVEIINETSYTEKAFNLTEKTLNSIYACNFPIILSSKGTVSFLRDMGLDVFDDIIDHSYDLIEDPIDRMFSAVINNRELLTNNERTKTLWKENKNRFLRNVEFVKDDLYKFYQDRAETQFFKILENL
jgi:hypothetical protein